MSEQNPQPPPASTSLGPDLALPGPLLAACPLSRLAEALAALKRQELGLPWARLHEELRHGGRGKESGRKLQERAKRARMIAPRYGRRRTCSTATG